MKNIKILTATLLIILMASMMALGAPSYGNVGPTTEFNFDIKIIDEIVAEGATPDGWETTIFFTDPTADRTITVPDFDVTLGTSTTIAPAAIHGLAADTLADADEFIFYDETGAHLNKITWINLMGSITKVGTVTSGTLSTGAVLADVTMTLGSDADGDVYYRASNVLTRLAKGTATQVLTMNAGETAPEWAAAGDGYTNLTSFVEQTAWRLFYSNTDGDVIELALGADGTFLGSNGVAVAPTFSVPGGAGDVVKVGTPADSQVGVWTGDGTIEGAATLTYDGANFLLTGDIGKTDGKITKGWFTDMTVANAIAGDITGNAATVTNATFTTALTVNTGTLTLTAAGANNSVLTIGAGAVSVSGSNTGDQTTVSGNAGTVTVDATTTDTTCFVGIFESASGSLEPQTDATLTYNANTGVLTSTFAGALTGNVTGDCSGSSGTCSGLAATATALATARTIGGVSFDGTANIIPNIATDTTPELGGEMDCGAHSIGFTLQTDTGTGAKTIDWKLGNKMKFTFGAGNVVFTFTAPTNPCTLMLTIIQDGTGSRTITFPATVKWAGGVAPTLTTTANARDKIALDWDGTQYDGVCSNDFK